MVVGKDDEAVNYVISATTFGCLTFVEVVDHLIYLCGPDIPERRGSYYHGLYNLLWDLGTLNYCPTLTGG